MSVLNKIKAWISSEWRYLTTFNASDRHWAMPFCAALASGIPLLIGVYSDKMTYGLVSSLGCTVFLYTPNTPLHHRMVTLMACSFGMSACYALGVMAHFVPLLLIPVLTLLVILVSMVCRFYRLAPPGSLFFVMAAGIGVYSPVDVLQIPLFVGLLTMGCLLACLVAFFYSIYILRLQEPAANSPLPPADFDFVVFDSLVIGVFVGLSVALAQAFQMERAYWVPVSCLAVIQGNSLRAVVSRKIHRILGTSVGLVLTWALLELPLNGWAIALLMSVLVFIIETLVVRHYAFAVVFITPLTIFLADAALLGQGSPDAIILARLLDTVLGCVIGVLAGICLHNQRLRDVASPRIKRMISARLLP